MANIRSITPNDPANFTPVLGNYKTLQPFRYWCQKVLPLVYDDSLSYYELLCKVVDYLNKTMEDVETLHGDVTKLHTAYEKLQSYVNNYFSTLDVQEEINNKLDDMASDGTLSTLVNPLIITAVGDWLSKNLTPTTPTIDKTLTVSNAGADSKTVGDNVFSMLSYVSPIELGSSEGSSDITDLSDVMNIYTAYIMWSNAIKSLYSAGKITSDIPGLADEFNSLPYVYLIPMNVQPMGSRNNKISALGYYAPYIAITYGRRYNISIDKGGIVIEGRILNSNGTFDPTLTNENSPANAKVVGDNVFSMLSYVSPIELGSSEGSSDITDLSDVMNIYTAYIMWSNAIKSLYSAGKITSDIPGLADEFNSLPYVYLIPMNVQPMGSRNNKISALGYYAPYIAITYGRRYNISIDKGGIVIEGRILNSNGTLDSTLTDPNSPANAKAVGDAISAIDVQADLTSPNGNKWYLSVDNDGNLSANPYIPKHITFIGNSLLLGFGSFGMAATNKNGDYYTKILSRTGATGTKIGGVDWEGATTVSLANKAADNIINQINADSGLIIIQLGDNWNNENTVANLPTTLPYLIKGIREKCPKARVCWVFAWYYKQNAVQILQNNCKLYGVKFINIDGLSSVQSNQNKIGAIYTYDTDQTVTYSVDSFSILEDNKVTLNFTVGGVPYSVTINYTSYTSTAGVSITVTGKECVITNASVASHPSDTGFTQIADKIITEMAL